MAYLWLKSFHIIGVVVWFAGLFYLVRLYVYHREADARPEPERTILQKQFTIMEDRLLSIITTPGLFVTVGTAIGLLYTNPAYLKSSWLHAKLFFVFNLVIYHISCIKLQRQIQAGKCAWSAQRFRAFNELPTLLLVTIVLLVVFKEAFPTSATVWLIFGLILSMVIAIQLYAKRRRLQSAKD